jgi:hypothetical protein
MDEMKPPITGLTEIQRILESREGKVRTQTMQYTEYAKPSGATDASVCSRRGIHCIAICYNRRCLRTATSAVNVST